MLKMFFIGYRLYNEIIYISLDNHMYYLIEDLSHGALICSTGVFETFGHNLVTIYAYWSAKGCALSRQASLSFANEVHISV